MNMIKESKLTLQAGVITGLVLAVLLSAMFLMKSLPCSPVMLIGFAALFPVAGFVAGRNATAHPIWASVISALVASLGIIILGLATMETSSDADASNGGMARIATLLMMAQMMFQMWIQQTAVLTGLSAAGGALALFINRKKLGSSNKKVEHISDSASAV
jgi:hypothetical protein